MRMLLAIPLLLFGSTTSAASTSEFCASLTDLAKQVEILTKPVHLSAWVDPETFACGPVNQQTKRFCDAAIAASGIEFAHRFPWLLHDCVKSNGQLFEALTTDDWTGFKRKRLVHLSGYIDRSAIDVRYEASSAASLKSDIYGKYVVTIWRP